MNKPILEEHGRKNEKRNLQALCFKCNANKGARDDVDFRIIREGSKRGKSGCIFCEIPREGTSFTTRSALAIRDKYPVTGLHTRDTQTARCNFLRFV